MCQIYKISDTYDAIYVMYLLTSENSAKILISPVREFLLLKMTYHYVTLTVFFGKPLPSVSRIRGNLACKRFGFLTPGGSKVVGSWGAERVECGKRVPLPRKILKFYAKNGVLWCILIYYFRASMREAAGLRVQGTGYNPRKIFF